MQGDKNKLTDRCREFDRSVTLFLRDNKYDPLRLKHRVQECSDKKMWPPPPTAHMEYVEGLKFSPNGSMRITTHQNDF